MFDYKMPLRCALGCKRNNTSLHRFPNPKKHPEKFKAWVKVTGETLQNPVNVQQYKKKRICDIHFRQKDRNRNNRLNALAVPSLNLPKPGSRNNIESESDEDFYETEYLEGFDDDELENKDKLKPQDTESDYETEYLEEFDEYEENGDVYPAHTDIKPTKTVNDRNTTGFEEIDSLFLSYAATFKKLSGVFQTMLKLDIAKLFARYEMKNAAFHEGKQEKNTNITHKAKAIIPHTNQYVFTNLHEPDFKVSENNNKISTNYTKSMILSQVNNMSKRLSTREPLSHPYKGDNIRSTSTKANTKQGGLLKVLAHSQNQKSNQIIMYKCISNTNKTNSLRQAAVKQEMPTERTRISDEHILHVNIPTCDWTAEEVKIEPKNEFTNS